MDTQIGNKARPKSRASRDIVIAYAKGAETAQVVQSCLRQLSADQGAPTLLLMFVGGKHDPDAVLRAVRSVHQDVPVVGGAAAGVISREGFGYSGFEIGIAAWHSPDTTPQFYSTDALYESDHEGGRRLGRMARDNGAYAAPILLFYDSVRSYEPRQLHVAGSVVAGFREGWGDGAPNLVGGGVLTDLNLTDGWILTGNTVKRHAAFALVFPEAFKVETQILRACRPVSAYMNITQKKGAKIYALDGRPALDVIEERLDQPLIGADGQPTRIMTLGQKIGDPFEHGTPDDYVNRLIITADLERRSITLFEPDFAEGSRVQLMINDNEVMLESARRGAATARRLGTLKPRVRPMLRLYIDCAGRASVVTGAQPEEATVVLQELASDDVPFLGFYSGVEIAPVRGDPRPLDWTGVLTTLLETSRGD